MGVSRREFLASACAAGAAGMLAGAGGPAAANADDSDPSTALYQKHDPYNFGQFAPPDAFENGSKLAYYGSENDWGPRQFSAEEAEKHYKRLGQRHIYLIMNGHADRAAQSCRAHIAKDPHDLESRFTLVVAQCQLGEIDIALATMKQSIAAGLPLERFLAGPRDLLAPLTSSPGFLDYLAKHPARLIHGPMLGAMTDHGVRIWGRTADESKVTVRVFEQKANGNPVAISSANTTKQADFTAVVPIGGLKPDTQYFYDLVVNGKPVESAPRYPLRTFPVAGAPIKLRIVHGGCAGYYPQNERMWDMIASFHPAAVLLMGDNVYIDLPQEAGPLHRYSMYQRQSRPEFRRLVSTTPIFAIWDDHDAAFDDIWLGPYRDKPSWKPSMFTLFEQNWNNPSYGARDWPGCWFRFSIGDVDFFMLDGRYYRTNPFAEKCTMLGPIQKAWLLDGLKKSKATFKIIASPVAWEAGAKPGSRDTWEGFPTEREEIFSTIEKNGIDGVVLLSADRHRSDAWKIPRTNGYAYYDLMSSRLTNTETHELMPGALFGYNAKCSFGLLTLDTLRNDPQITYDVVNIDGETVNSLTIHKSELTFPTKKH
jgi:alkaline phosphatase D